MSGRLTPISGCGAKGPACFLVESGDARLLLDLGYGPQPGLWPDVSKVGAVDALLLSHSHNDHAGGLKLLPAVGNPRVHATDIVRRLLPAGCDAATLPLRGSGEVCGIRITTGRNGHAPGGIWLHLEIGGGLLYMGDYSVDSALFAYDPPPQAATVILDASYGVYDTARDDALRAFDGVYDGGPVLMPVPAAGRGPEIAVELSRSGRACAHIDASIRASIESLSAQYADCVRDAAPAQLNTIAREARSIEGAEGVMLASTADASGGEAAKLVELWQTAGPAIVFTGYLSPGTPAERLTKSGRARYLRWPVHPRLSDNAHLVRSTAAQTVLPAFGDASHLAAWQAAFSPARVVVKGPVSL
jgi:Cft2 family RNA processing exonuclease